MPPVLDARCVNARRHLLQITAVEAFAALDDTGVDSMLLKDDSIARLLDPPDETLLMRRLCQESWRSPKAMAQAFRPRAGS